jgi:hypothetical protein
VNPAEADDLRQELRAHLEELVESYSAGGASRHEATDLALAWFGDAHRLHDYLDRVHQGDAWWIRRLKGLGLGMLIGGLLALLLPVGGHLEFVARLFGVPPGIDASRFHMLVNALIAGGVIGLFSAGSRSLLIGWSVGSLAWLVEYMAYWIGSVAAGSGGDLSTMNSVLLAPLAGGAFGAAVGSGAAALLVLTSRARPEIR